MIRLSPLRKLNGEIMNTETEDRRSTQVSGAACGNVWPHVGKGMRCLKTNGHSGECAGSSWGPSDDSLLDRSDEFDQTRQHIHMERSLCPVLDCKEWPTVGGERLSPPVREWLQREAVLPPRHVSPAITEFQTEQLKEAIETKDGLLEGLRAENQVLRDRIAGFERMTGTMSEYIDICEARFKEMSAELMAGFKNYGAAA